MPNEDYEHLYYLLFNGITDTIESLKELQVKAEELYTGPDNPGIIIEFGKGSILHEEDKEKT